MIKSELLELIKDMQDTDTVDNLFKHETNYDDVVKYLSEKEDGRKYMDTYADTRVTSGIETWKRKHLQEEVEKELKKYDLKNSTKKTPEQLEIEELKKKFEESERKALKLERTNKLNKQLKENNIDTKLVDLFYSDDDDDIKNRIELYTSTFNDNVKNEVAKRVHEGSYTPAEGQANKTDEVDDMASRMLKRNF